MRGTHGRRPVAAYFGHHKCGSRWIAEVVEQVCDESGLSNWSTADAGPFADGTVATWAERERIDVVSFTNAHPHFLPAVGQLRGFHVVRDPRDICVSAYYSHRHSHSTEVWPQLAPVRTRLGEIGVDEGLAFELEFLAPVFESMEAWDYTRPDVLELRFEDLVADDVGGLTRAIEFIGLGPGGGRALDGPSALHVVAQKVRRRLGLAASTRRLKRERLASIIGAHSFAAKAGGRRRGDVDEQSHYRSGTPGDWRTHFTAEHVTQFKTAYPTLLARLGYAEDW
ncbi:MAG TPA: sulfotransferase domain-containing protein [Acidimicrobiia bacterium]|nr:sulfotransferase domain-containing protein [Acidimicrobiia bacterium]